MYLRQMGKVPLLTREQEVAICKRIEASENEQRRIVYSLGFAAKEHIALAEKLMSEPPKERFDRVIEESKIFSVLRTQVFSLPGNPGGEDRRRGSLGLASEPEPSNHWLEVE